jgi:hypothetical protein
LQQLAITRRADLKALSDRIASEEAGLAPAIREYYPDVEAGLRDRYYDATADLYRRATLERVITNRPH